MNAILAVRILLDRVRSVRSILEARLQSANTDDDTNRLLAFGVPTRQAEEPIDLASLSANPERAEQVPLEAIPSILGEVRRIEAVLWARLINMSRTKNETGGAEEDRLLDVREAALMLAVSADYLYRNAKRFPFTLRVGSRVRFSRRGIERFIRQRSGGHVEIPREIRPGSRSPAS
jgi:predicted DNA-binding transcriptional regulator AlpA